LNVHGLRHTKHSGMRGKIRKNDIRFVLSKRVSHSSGNFCYGLIYQTIYCKMTPASFMLVDFLKGTRQIKMIARTCPMLTDCTKSERVIVSEKATEGVCQSVSSTGRNGRASTAKPIESSSTSSSVAGPTACMPGSTASRCGHVRCAAENLISL
jgi:hypothetical protein